MFKLTDLKVINTKSKERTLLSNFDHSKLNEQELVEVIMLLKGLSKDIREKQSEVELFFFDKMREKNAHKYHDGKVEAKVQQNREYEYIPQIIEELRPLLTEEQFNSTFTKTYTVNRKTLKNLLALGGEVKEIIERATKLKEYKPTIKIEKIS